MIQWEAWCYRCRDRESGQEPNETVASERITDFRRAHQESCGVGASIGHITSSVPPATQYISLTGDGFTRTEEP